VNLDFFVWLVGFVGLVRLRTCYSEIERLRCRFFVFFCLDFLAELEEESDGDFPRGDRVL
jgi:hypothetical protein